MHQILQKMIGISIPWADSHLDCLLCMPLLLTGWLMERRYFFYQNPQHRLSGAEIFFVTALLALLFEWGFPLLSPKFTADWWDVPAYFAGSLIFWKYLND